MERTETPVGCVEEEKESSQGYVLDLGLETGEGTGRMRMFFICSKDKMD